MRGRLNIVIVGRSADDSRVIILRVGRSLIPAFLVIVCISQREIHPNLLRDEMRETYGTTGIPIKNTGGLARGGVCTLRIEAATVTRTSPTSSRSADLRIEPVLRI